MAARERRIAQVAAGIGTSDRSIKDARLRASDCEDELEVAKGAAESIESTLPDLEHDLAKARERVLVAAKAVVTAAAPVLVERANRMHDELESLRATLTFLHGLFQFPPPSPARNEIERVVARGFGQGDLGEANKWHAALQSLLTDASTALPD